MKISVIIPTYKPQAYLWECLDSLVAQTFSKEDFEVILVLNGCTEPWKSRIQEYIATKMNGMNVKFIHTEQGGVSNARNLALNAVEGDYLTFVDDDDFLSPNTLLRLSEASNITCVTIFKPLAFYDETHDFFFYARTKEFEKYKDNGQVFFWKVRKIFGGPVMKLFPCQIIGERRFNLAFKNGEDSLFMFLISDRMIYVNFASDDAIYYRRIRHNSATTTNKTFMDVFKNSIKLSFEYSKIYGRNMREYKLGFYITRLLGCVRAVLNYKNVTF